MDWELVGVSFYCYLRIRFNEVVHQKLDYIISFIVLLKVKRIRENMIMISIKGVITTFNFNPLGLKLSKFLQRTCTGISYFPCYRLHVLISSTGTQKSRQYRKGQVKT